MQQSGDITKMIVAVAQPKVTEATIKAAVESLPITMRNKDGEIEIIGWTNGDIKAQEIFHKATGFLPMPKGAQTTINLNQLNQTAQLSASDDDDDPTELKSMDEYLMELQDVIRPAKQLEAPPSFVIPQNAPMVEYLDVEV